MLDYDLRQKLIEVAKSKGTISYLELRPDAPQTLAAPLDEINKYEQGEGRPLLSAVVVHKEGDGMPGVGFFTIAWELGQYGGGEADQAWDSTDFIDTAFLSIAGGIIAGIVVILLEWSFRA